jgi:hypothetical protein
MADQKSILLESIDVRVAFPGTEFLTLVASKIAVDDMKTATNGRDSHCTLTNRRHNVATLQLTQDRAALENYVFGIEQPSNRVPRALNHLVTLEFSYCSLRSGNTMLNNWRRSVLPALLLLILPVMSMAQVGVNISINLAPPELPVYEQPAIPDDGYLWTPGYWAWADDEQAYFWVPGTWVVAPQPGYLWTPGYWGSNDGAFVWNQGYWGEQVGFYGGVNYGYGYGGSGFQGGYWQSGHLFYNTAVMNVGTRTITNVYNKRVVDNVTVTRVSYNGGNGGVHVQATAGEMAVAHAQHLPPTTSQQQHVQAARSNPGLRASANHGNPPIAATAKPGVFSGAGVVAAKGGASASEPVEHKVAPIAHATAPVEHNNEPVEHKVAPIAHATAPVEHNNEPVEHKVAPIAHVAAPVEHKSEPVERKVAPVAHVAAPVEHKSEPVEHKVAPVAHVAAPVEHKSEPVERKSEPVEHKVAPVAHAAPPVERKTVPVGKNEADHQQP